MRKFFAEHWKAIVPIALTILGLGGCLIKFGVDEAHRVEEVNRAARLEQNRRAEAERQRQEAFFREQQRKQEEDERAQPYLQFLSGQGPGSDKLTHVRFHNRSALRNAVIYILHLRVTDPALLRIIESKHPKPKEPFAGAG